MQHDIDTDDTSFGVTKRVYLGEQVASQENIGTDDDTSDIQEQEQMVSDAGMDDTTGGATHVSNDHNTQPQALHYTGQPTKRTPLSQFCLWCCLLWTTLESDRFPLLCWWSDHDSSYA